MADTRLNLLMQEAGFISLPPAPDTPEDAGAAWFLPVSDLRADARHDPARNRLILSAGVGQPVPWLRNELFELILQYNDHCQETGVRLGLEEEDDNVVIVMDLPLDWLRNGGLARAFFTLADLRGTWHRIVEKDVTQDSASLPPATVARQHIAGRIHV